MLGKFPRKHLWVGSFLKWEAEVKAMDFFPWIFRKFLEYLRLDKIVFKERCFQQMDNFATEHQGTAASGSSCNVKNKSGC